MRSLRTVLAYDGPGTKILIVELIERHQAERPYGSWLAASLRPIAIVVSTPSGAYALDLESRPADLEQLRRDDPTLTPALERCESRWSGAQADRHR